MKKNRSTEYKLALNEYIKNLKKSNFKITASKLRLELQILLTVIITQLKWTKKVMA